jgi:hypothetical protein
MIPSPHRHPNNIAVRNDLHTGKEPAGAQGDDVTESTIGFAATRAGHAFPEFHDVTDVADCALDEQLEQLQRLYAAASRAASRSKFEVDLLEKRDDIHPHILAQARRQRAAAETRSAQLLRAIDALEDRLENE